MTLILNVKSLSLKDGLININHLLVKTGIHVFLGKNGSGKTTLLKFFATILNENPSDYSLNGKDVNKLSLKEISECFSFLPQNLNKNPSLDVDEFIQLLPQKKSPSFREKERLLEYFDLKKLLSKKTTHISDGQWKLVQIVRLFLQDTKVFVLDEPECFLDIINIEKLKTLIEDKRDEKIFLISSHNLSFVNSFKKRTLFLINKNSLSPLEKNTNTGLKEDILKRFRA